MKDQSRWLRWLMLALLIGAAVGCYSIGFVAGFGFFSGLGIVFELIFWKKLFKKNKIPDKV